MRTIRRLPAPAILLLGLLALAAQRAAAADLTMSMTPRYSPEEMLARNTPLKELLSRAAAQPIQWVITPNFKEFESRVMSGGIDIAHINPIIYPAVSQVHEILATISAGPGGARLRGIIITRADSALISVEDLKGRSAAYVDQRSIGGYLSQKITLGKAGIRLPEDMRLEQARDNKQENVILSVYYGDVDVGFINEDSLYVADQYVPRSQIRVIKRGAWMPNWGISVSRTLPAAVKDSIRQAVTKLPPDDPVLKALKIDAFVPATDADYDVVREAAGMPIPQR